MTDSAVYRACAAAEEPSAFGDCYRQLSSSSGTNSAWEFHFGAFEPGFSSGQSQLLRSESEGPADSLSL